MDIYSPIQIKQLAIQNRIMRSATAERMADDTTGIPTPSYAGHYRALSEGGVGLIVTGHMYVDRRGQCHPEMTAIDNDEVIPVLQDVVEMVHHTSARIIAQINFGGLQCAMGVNTINLAPSAFADHGNTTADNREITADELEQLIDAYAQAALRVQKAGFDGMMLHGAHGYFISQMLSPAVNRRTDRWGGSFDRRLTFLSEVAKAVRTAVTGHFPLFIKLGVQDGVPGGLSLEEGMRVVERLEGWGFDGVEISGGFRFNAMSTVSKPKDEAYFRPWARMAKKFTNLPVFCVGGFRSLAEMNDTLQSGDADMISLCRPLICEPDLIHKFQNKEKDTADCISCNRCFAKEMNQGTRCRWKEDRQVAVKQVLG
ncbi:MAG: NADH:flavin oxidoreductase [Anaerolineae bacterium]|nr:NADH:flavin oxidoreductase [Anaerolineae bacterium]